MSPSNVQANSASSYVRMIKEICYENNIEWKSFSYDWVFELSKNSKTRYILGYQFDLNTAAVHSICKDKCATADILISRGIPCVEHFFFMSPVNAKYLGSYGNWLAMKELLDRYQKIICKPNEGTGGNNVFVASNQRELELAVDDIFKSSRGMVINPYYDIQDEYRIIFLNGQAKLVFTKQRPFVTGDGASTISKLMFEYIEANNIDDIGIELGEKSYQSVLKSGEIFSLNWKHNLGQGASAQILEDEAVISKLKPLVERTAQALNLKFASIDIIKANDAYMVLEVHGGVMMEHFATQNADYYKIAKNIYKEAIELMFE